MNTGYLQAENTVKHKATPHKNINRIINVVYKLVILCPSPLNNTITGSEWLVSCFPPGHIQSVRGPPILRKMSMTKQTDTHC